MTKNKASEHPSHLIFRRIRNELSREIRRAKSQHYGNRFIAFGNNKKRQWDLVNEIIGENGSGTSVTRLPSGIEDKELADRFNEYFLGVGENDELNRGKNSEPGRENFGSSRDSIYVIEVDKMEMYKIYQSLLNRPLVRMEFLLMF